MTEAMLGAAQLIICLGSLSKTPAPHCFGDQLENDVLKRELIKALFSNGGEDGEEDEHRKISHSKPLQCILQKKTAPSRGEVKPYVKELDIQKRRPYAGCRPYKLYSLLPSQLAWRINRQLEWGCAWGRYETDGMGCATHPQI